MVTIKTAVLAALFRRLSSAATALSGFSALHLSHRAAIAFFAVVPKPFFGLETLPPFLPISVITAEMVFWLIFFFLVAISAYKYTPRYT